MKYGVSALPEEIRTFNSKQECKDILTQYRLGKNLVDTGYNYDNYFMYVFPDGSFCTICVDGYTNKTPTWTYWKNIKNIDSGISNYFHRCNIINSVEDILKETNPYGYAFAVQEKIHPLALVFFPQLEQLKKAGYSIADTIISKFNDSFNASIYGWRCLRLDSNDYKMIGMMFHKGTSLYEMLGFSRDIAKEMKDVDSIKFWNICRKLMKKNLLNVESLRFLKEANYDDKSFQSLYSIVTKGVDGRNYFTIPSLLRYLRKVDMYEAIDHKEALMLIQDYIRCCHMLSVNPRFDSDSLKREHDVMARNARTMIEKNRRIEMNEKMKSACANLHKYDYKEDIFFVRAIDSFDDLLDEPTQQVNCVSGYANSIAKGTSKIFVMRETARPDKSLITIELSPDNSVRQKYLSHNRPIRNKAQSDFIDRWVKHIRKAS